MSTLVTKKKMLKTSLIYLLITILCLVFKYIYYQHSHNVYSDYMSYMFLVPLIGGTIMYFIFILKKFKINYKFYNLYNAALATFSVGLILKGIFEIAGTSSTLVNIYFITGFILIISSFIFNKIKKRV